MFSSGLSGRPITLNDGTLPAIVNTLTIQGPSASPPAITISGAGQFQVMSVNGGATFNLVYLTIADGSGFAGGIINEGTLTVVNSTLSDNSGGGMGGIGNFGTVNLKGTILAASGASGHNCFGSITDEGYNLSDDGTCDFASTSSSQNSVLDTQLKLGPLQNNGGPTQTIALGAGSVAIDAIPLADCIYQNVNPCTNPPTTSPSGPLTCDQRGEPRPDFGEVVCDIGAYESQETFAGQPGSPNCHGQSVSALANQYGSLAAAASALGFPSVQVLQNAIRAWCKE